MAGFVGVCSNSLKESEHQITDALQATVYAAHTHHAMLLNEAPFLLGRSFVTFLETEKRVASAHGVSVYVDGEIFAYPKSGTENNTYAQQVLSSYTTDQLHKLIFNTDGIFIIIIFDSVKKQLLLITDRFGLKPFYVAEQNGAFFFAPEVKCFSYFSSFQLKVRKEHVECFLTLGHFLGSGTWLESVYLAEPATVYTYRWQEQSLKTEMYWSWGKIRRSNLTLSDAADELGQRLDTTFNNQFGGNFRTGIGLSGGLDSRCLLAAVHNRNPVTYTFGIEKSADVAVARQVARVANVKHHYFDLKIDHWLQRRFSGVWKTDGMLNMYHMHYSHLMNELPKWFDVNLSGFLGDVVIGGSYLKKEGKSFVNRAVNESIAAHYFGNFASQSNYKNSYFDTERVDPFVIYNRGRRLIGMGAEEANKTIPQRLPFMSVPLMEFAYSLPDELRADSKVYDLALLRKYPAFYKNIPNASKGVPIIENPDFFWRAKKALHYATQGLKYRLGMSISYTDVFNWIKEPETATQIRALLDPKKALYRDLIDVNFLTQFVEPHIEGKKNHTRQIMVALTIEVWLQQLLNNKFRD